MGIRAKGNTRRSAQRSAQRSTWIGTGISLGLPTLALSTLGLSTLGLTTLAFAGDGSSLAGASEAVSSSHAVTITSQHIAKLGTVLTTAKGQTLYRFTADPNGKVTCTGECAKVWPPVLVPKGDKIKAPHGLKDFSTIRLSGGRRQLAFHGIALYRFAGDKHKGSAAGQGVEGTWFVVAASNVIKAPPTSTTSSAPSSTSTTAVPAPGANSVTPTTKAPTKSVTPTTKVSTPAPTPTSPTPTSPTPTSPTTTPTTSAPPTTTTPTTAPKPPPTTTTPTTSPPTGGGVGF